MAPGSCRVGNSSSPNASPAARTVAPTALPPRELRRSLRFARVAGHHKRPLATLISLSLVSYARGRAPRSSRSAAHSGRPLRRHGCVREVAQSVADPPARHQSQRGRPHAAAGAAAAMQRAAPPAPQHALPPPTPDTARVILHFDVDCMYAQAEELRNPALAGRPLGVTQKCAPRRAPHPPACPRRRPCAPMRAAWAAKAHTPCAPQVPDCDLQLPCARRGRHKADGNC